MDSGPSGGLQPKGKPGRKKRILSLDGGGVRGIISAVILQRLESHLQDLEQTDIRIADYFDAIAGTSTGGLIACLLVVPDQETKRPKYTAQDAVKFYLEKAAVVFPRDSFVRKQQTSEESERGFLRGPSYSSAPLEKLLNDTFGDLKLSETVKPVVVPSYDIYSENPVLFSTTQVKSKQIPDCFIHDVCRATSAAPTYFAPYYFSVTTDDGPREFNMVDGGIFANNPTFIAVSELLKDNSNGPEPPKYEDLLVLSLGTGNTTVSYSAKDAAKWGTISWILNNGNAPILDMLMGASQDMVDYNLSNAFHEQQSQANYLRIQTSDLKGDQKKLDNSSPENLKALVAIANKLLGEQSVQQTKLGEFVSDLRFRRTYDEELKQFAQWLVDEKEAQRRLGQPSFTP